MNQREQKVFNKAAITIATFFGGPVAATLLISRNYKSFGREEQARQALYFGLIITLLLFLGIYLIPDVIFNQIALFLPAIYTAIISFIVERLQGKEIQNYLESGRKMASNWLAIGYGFIGLLIIVVFIAFMFNIMPIEGYENKVRLKRNVNLYYGDDIDKTTSGTIAEIIIESGFIEENQSVDMFLEENEKEYLIKFVLLNPEVLEDSTIIIEFNTLEQYINLNYNFTKKVEIGFVDANLVEHYNLPEIERSLVTIYNPLLELKKYLISDFHTIFYNDQMPEDDIIKLAEAIQLLKGYFPVNQHIDIVFLNEKSHYTLKLFVSKDLWKEKSVTRRLISTRDYIKGMGINQKINLVLVDNLTYEERALNRKKQL